jgi:HK97 family phage major capsid protein
MRIKHENGKIFVDGELAEVVGEGEERQLDFFGEVVPDAAYRRARIRDLDSEVANPLRTAFREYLRHGKEAVIPEEVRAQTVGTGSSGGYLAPQGFARQIFTMMKQVDALFDESVISIIETTSGTLEPVPLFDDTSSTAAIVAENGALSVADVAFDQLLLAAAANWRTPMVKCSLELTQDAAFDIEALLAKAFAAQLARGIAPSLVTTLTAGATQGVATGSSITVDNVYDLFGSLDAAYLSSPKCAWAMRLSTLIAISKLKDTAGLPVFPLTRNANGDFELLTLPVRICPSIPAVGVGAKSLFVGDLSYLVMRRVQNSLAARRFDETYATAAQVGFCSFLRVSSGFAKPSASDSPVKFLQHS